MTALEDDIKRVHEKLQQVLKQHVLLQKENERLKELTNKIQKEKDEYLQHAQQLQQQVSILKSVAGEMNEVDKKAFEKSISQYISEIDKCITLLSE
jgi:hypothetical protein